MMELSSISDRRAVWIAQSDLFLDTDVRLSYSYIARTTAESPFSMAELEAIFRDEVAPIVEPNLLDIAGEWAGFPDEWLVRSITERLAGDPKKPYRFQTGVLQQWHAVALLAERLRTLPPEQRERRWRMWKQLEALFLHKEPAPPEAWAMGYGESELQWIFREEMMPSYGESIEVYAKHSPGLYPVRREVEARWLVWLGTTR